MKPVNKIAISIFLGLLVTTGAQAGTPLTITTTTPYGCLENAYINPPVTSSSNSFALPDCTGIGSIHSSWHEFAPSFSSPPIIYSYGYTIDVSKMSSSVSHCISLVVHFGEPVGCDYDEVEANPAQFESATLSPFGDISFVFNGGCLLPAQPAVGMSMFTMTGAKLGKVTVIDSYTDPQTGEPVLFETNVTAYVPDIAPDPPWWERYAETPGLQLPNPWIQGLLSNGGSNEPAGLLNGSYDFQIQLKSSLSSNAMVVTPMVTQTVQVVNGLFNMPLPFDPISMGDASTRFVNIGVRPSGLPAVQFTPIAPLPINPAPQALYADTAGAVADLLPGQAVTSLNGLTDDLNLQAGNGISLSINNSNTIIIAVTGSSSDRNIKTDFAQVDAGTILAKLAALPIESWRYTNEMSGVRHVGPMAQDFKAAFGLGNDDKIIGFVDAQGVALAAIQGLNQKLNDKDTVIQEQSTEIAELKARLDKLEQVVNAKSRDER